MRLIGQIKHTWENTVQFCGEFIYGVLRKQHSVKPVLLVRSTARN